MFKNCLKFEFKINDIPNAATEDVFVLVNVIGSISMERFDNLTAYSRKLTGQGHLLLKKYLEIPYVILITNNLNNIMVWTLQSRESSKSQEVLRKSLKSQEVLRKSLKSQEVLTKVKSEHEAKSRHIDDM